VLVSAYLRYVIVELLCCVAFCIVLFKLVDLIEDEEGCAADETTKGEGTMQ
jgi:hypothetical protein